MKIVATVRAKNEEANIERFCMSYQNIADTILVADGGSTDRTVEIAEAIPKVKVKPFHLRMQVGGGHWINPQGRHVNFLIDWALEEGADWIIFDDCDCVPNFLLKLQAKQWIDTANIRGNEAIYLRRVYFWGDDQIFPNLHKPNTSIWAWKKEVNVRALEADPWHLTMKIADLRPNGLHLQFPLCLLHYSWPSPEATDEKLNFYRTSGVQPTAMHPEGFAGPKAPAEWFMSPYEPK
ncbi:hypothetical protein LCGC14_1113260 [marine sediment metagenome]|uniref:Glycosyltransferase 2-like domain-containing protein n=1 Tax=marine sediment metagenome TaxID=412755 RepID=A0A0F9M653_9ZZZZ